MHTTHPHFTTSNPTTNMMQEFSRPSENYRGISHTRYLLTERFNQDSGLKNTLPVQSLLINKYVVKIYLIFLVMLCFPLLSIFSSSPAYFSLGNRPNQSSTVSSPVIAGPYLVEPSPMNLRCLKYLLVPELIIVFFIFVVSFHFDLFGQSILIFVSCSPGFGAPQ